MRLSFGGSSTLAVQIENGAPADLYLSADRKWMDYLEARSVLEQGTRVDLLGNSLVIVAPKGEGFKVDIRKDFDFPGSFTGRLAVADPSHVPAGVYARQALQWLGWWDALADRLAPATDVRGALVYVARGECSAGIVYATDAAASPKVEVVAVLPAESHEAIVYPAGIIRGRGSPRVRRVLEFLKSSDAERTFQANGFTVLRSGRKGIE